MKWKRQHEAVVPEPEKPIPFPVPEFREIETPSAFFLECIACVEKASTIFEGSSYCRECLKRKMTTGLTRRFYE